MRAGRLLLTDYFFVSREALKRRLGSKEAHESIWIPALRVGVQCAWASLSVPVRCPGRALGPQHHLINLGFPSHIFSDPKNRVARVSLSRKPVSLVAGSQRTTCLPLASMSLCTHSCAGVGIEKGLAPVIQQAWISLLASGEGPWPLPPFWLQTLLPDH